MTISAKIIAHSASNETGRQIITYELEYPRFIHSEFMTHRMFSRNAASSRAIPVKRAIELVAEDTAKPSHWGKNQSGMSAREEWDAPVSYPHLTPVDASKEDAWTMARDAAILHAGAFADAGYHKQIVNRLLEPFTHIKVVCTATDYTNFFWLRNHADAQPEIRELAEAMIEAAEGSWSEILKPGEWHVPYYNGAQGDGIWIPTANYRMVDGVPVPLDGINGHTLHEALMISSSQCAQVSYRRADDSLEKAIDIYDRLVNTQPVHASPFEHQATPFDYGYEGDMFNVGGVTHCDASRQAWSGNFCDFIQYRQLIPGNAMNK